MILKYIGLKISTTYFRLTSWIASIFEQFKEAATIVYSINHHNIIVLP